MFKVALSLAALAVVAASQAVIYGFAAPVIDGSQEVPNPVTTNAFGTGSFTVDSMTFEVAGAVTVFNIADRLTMGHIHRGARGTNGPVIYDILMTDIGRVNNGNMTTIAFRGTLAGGQASLDEMIAGRSYFNFHTQRHPGGEMRGQIDCMGVVPEPGTLAVLGLGGVFAMLRKRRK